MAEKKLPEDKMVIIDDKKKEQVHISAPITSGKVLEESKLKKAARVFFAEDLDNIKDSLMDDIVKPRATQFGKDLVRKTQEGIVNGITSLAETIFWGKPKDKEGYGYYNGSRVNYVSYNKYYSNGEYSNSKYTGSSYSDRDPRTNLKRVAIGSYGEAEQVLGELISLIKKYGKASVGAYYEAVDIIPSAGDYNIGWYDLVDARIVYDTRSEGYIITFPKPVVFG